jgi:glucosyl-3-phosphoglycerate phosphatase
VSTPIRAQRVFLWRHGRTTWNMQRRFQGQADAPLDAVGRAQARTAAHHLAAHNPQAIVSSDLSRAADTAAELAALTGLRVRLDPRLRERSLGHWEGLTREEVQRRHPQEYADWIAGRPFLRGGWESRAEVAVRAAACLADVDAEVVVLVTHSATAVALAGHLLGMAESQWRAIAPLANCHWGEIRQEDGGWRLRCYNVGAVTPEVPPVPADAAAAEQVGPEPVDAETLGADGRTGTAR